MTNEEIKQLERCISRGVVAGIAGFMALALLLGLAIFAIVRMADILQ